MEPLRVLRFENSVYFTNIEGVIRAMLFTWLRIDDKSVCKVRLILGDEKAREVVSLFKNHDPSRGWECAELGEKLFDELRLLLNDTDTIRSVSTVKLA